MIWPTSTCEFRKDLLKLTICVVFTIHMQDLQPQPYNVQASRCSSPWRLLKFELGELGSRFARYCNLIIFKFRHRNAFPYKRSCLPPTETPVTPLIGVLCNPKNLTRKYFRQLLLLVLMIVFMFSLYWAYWVSLSFS